MQGDDHALEEEQDEDYDVEGIASLKPNKPKTKVQSSAPKKDWSLMGGDELDDFNLDLSSDSESDSESDPGSSASDLGSDDSGDDSDESVEKNKKGKKRPSETEPQGNFE